MKYLEYIQTNGTQAIEKEINMPIGTDVEIEMWFTPLPLENASDAFHAFFGTLLYSSNANGYELYQVNKADTGLAYQYQNTSNYSGTKIPFSYNTQYHVIMNNTGVTFNNVVVASYTETTSVSNFNKLMINKAETYNQRKQTAKYGEFILRQDGVETVHFYPALDDNNVPCMYDSVSDTFSYDIYENGFVAGPIASTIDVNIDKVTYPASGASATISVASETNWTVTSSENWATLSATAGTSADTAITVTFPSYTGDTKRSVTLTFTNTEDTIDLTLYQKKYSAGVTSEVYIAETNITELYLGDTQIENIYIGETEVYSSGPFIGLKCSPKTMELTNMTKSGNIVVRSSEDWTISSSESWLTLSVTGGTTGKTSLVATATDTESERTATITVSSATYSATCVVTQKAYTMPFNEIWVSTIDNTLSNLTLDNNKYFIDTDGNKMTTYTKQFDSTNSRWVITFPNNVAGQQGIVWGTRSTYKFVNIWLPATFIHPSADFLYGYTSSGVFHSKAFLGDSPCIAANGRILVNKDSTSTEYNYVVCCTHDVSTPLVIPEGVVGCSEGYAFINTTFTEITFPTTLAYFSTYYQFEACAVNTINFLATTAPTGTKHGSFSYWPTNVTVHYPTGSNYSGVQAICPPQWTWVGDL